MNEPLNIPLKPLIKVPPELSTVTVNDRAKFWGLLGRSALLLKREEILSGIDIWGRKFQPIKRTWGVRVPLIPHSETSRTYELLSLNFTAQGATLFWKHGGGRVPWKKVLGYHAYKHGPRNLPVRNTIGLSPKSREEIMAESEMWLAGFEAGKALAKTQPPTPPSSGKPLTRLERIIQQDKARQAGPQAPRRPKEVIEQEKLLKAAAKAAREAVAAKRAAEREKAKLERERAKAERERVKALKEAEKAAKTAASEAKKAAAEKAKAEKAKERERINKEKEKAKLAREAAREKTKAEKEKAKTTRQTARTKRETKKETRKLPVKPPEPSWPYDFPNPKTLTKKEAGKLWAEANRLAKEAAAESKAIMDEVRKNLKAPKAKPEPKPKPAPKPVTPKQTKAKFKSEGMLINPRAKMADRLELWKEGDTLVSMVKEVSSDASGFEKQFQENKKRAIELMYSIGNATGKDVEKLKVQMDMLIEQNRHDKPIMENAMRLAVENATKQLGLTSRQKAKIDVDMSAFKAVSSKEDVERVQKAVELMQNLYRGGKLYMEVKPIAAGGRANMKGNSINIDSKDPIEIIAHEITHLIEKDNPGIFKATMDFLGHRCGSESFVDMGTIAGGVRMKGEQGRKDKFDQFYDDPNDKATAYYAGKIYPGQPHNECLTMGVQALLTNPGKFAEKDPEWCKFVLGVLSGELRNLSYGG